MRKTKEQDLSYLPILLHQRRNIRSQLVYEIKFKQLNGSEGKRMALITYGFIKKERNDCQEMGVLL